MEPTTKSEGPALHPSTATEFVLRPGEASIASSSPGKDDGRRTLFSELLDRVRGLAIDRAWYKPGCHAVASAATISALQLGYEVVTQRDFRPDRLNISAAQTGEILFTLFGQGGREAELWVGEISDTFTVVFGEEELRLPIAKYELVA